MEVKPIDLYEFLVESELQHYYNSIKNELKITNAAHLKYASDEDLKQIGLSRPEIRRMRKFYEKYFHHGYLSKIKRLLQPPPRKEDNQNGMSTSSITSTLEQDKIPNSPNKSPNNKHIIPADQICVNKQLGSGEFGIVQQGVWTNGTERTQVAIKCLSRERMQSNPMEFLKEAAIMHAIDNENIVRLYGVVLDTDSLMLVTELAHLRSLLECLKDPGLRVSFLTVPTLCEFAMQICNGMMYLENKRLIHRDLAARNILVFSKNKVKISDFGLSRALGVGKDYYKTNFNVNLKLPIAWCAPECINYLRFTNASDVWAYGVCLWEMFSYGFQPWPALTGLQILSAIDEPNYQRLEQPECCPRDYYNLMLKCWQHDSMKRPKFSDIYLALPDMKPEQLKAVVNNLEPRKDHLLFRQGEIITVLDKNCNNNNSFWKGVLNSGKTGFFNPANTVAYVEGLPSSNNRDSFYRSNERGSKKKLRTEMISMPQNDLKHTGHVGLDGAYFGDVAFLNNSQNYNHLPRQIVTPYKPSEDIEQTPLLLPPTPTSPDSLQTASGYFPEENASSTNPTFINSNENTPKQHSSFGSSFDFPPSAANVCGGSTKSTATLFNSSNPFANEVLKENLALHNNNSYGLEVNAFTNVNLEDDTLDSSKKNRKLWLPANENEEQHEYHEISDDEITSDKVFDLGPSLLDEINSMFGSINASSSADIGVPKSPDVESINKRNEFTELTSKLSRKSSNDTNGNKSKKKNSHGQVKPISVKDEKILNHAIEIANEISARSMTDLVSDNSHQQIQSPKRKFSFRFPHLTHHNQTDKDGNSAHIKERKNFSEELQSIPDLQNIITNEGREAYNSLIEKKKTPMVHSLDTLKTCKTLPRNLLVNAQQLKIIDNESKQNQRTNFVDCESAGSMTLPVRGQKSRNNMDSNPLRILRDKNFAKLKTRPRTLNHDELFKTITTNGDDNENGDESPTYLTNTSTYTFPQETSTNINTKNNNHDTNPIPLPPRDRNKKMLTQAKRHVRKHPLIIPGYGVQRTLNKVTETTPIDEKTNFSFPNSAPASIENNLIYNCAINNDNANETSWQKITQQVVSTYDQSKMNGIDKLRRKEIENRNYENIQQITDIDSASVHFESVLEDDINKCDILSSPDVIDGFAPFAIQKEQYQKSKEINFQNTNISGLYAKEDELRNLDLEKKNVDFFKNQSMLVVKPSDELLNNALFNKIKQTINLSMQEHLEDSNSNKLSENYKNEEEQKLHLQNSVSCEDLLEFADKNPKCSDRGINSDEVRIMLKVLGKDISPEKCLTSLDFIKWDVHKAIKLIKLQNILQPVELNFNELVNALQQYEWDLQVTVLKLKGLK